jgi:hypothetical protein
MSSAANLLRDHFIPHEGNNHTPHVLHHRALFGYSVALVLLKVLVFAVAVMLPAAVVFSSAISQANIIALTNATRESLGLSDLTPNSQLQAAAQAKADDMMLNHYFAHTSPAGKTPWDWIHTAGYMYTLAGENLAAHYETSEDVTSGWLASPTHRANIVNERFSEIGIGISHGEFDDYDTFLVVQMFGEPVVVSAEPAPEPAVVPEIPPIETEPGAPVIEESSVVVTPAQAGGYEVSLAADHAQTVQVQVQETSIALQPETPQEDIQPEESVRWTGTINPDAVSIDSGGAPLYVHAQSADGAQTTQAVAWVAPQSQTDDIYAFSRPQANVKLFGLFTVQNLNDAAVRIYFLTMVGLGAALLVSVLAKVEKHRHSVTAHALIVILLAGFLAVL